MTFTDITPAMTADACTINGRDYVASVDSVLRDYYAHRAFYNASDNYVWYSNNQAFPHWWQIDMGGLSLLQELAFTPNYDRVDVTIKDYKIEYSLDSINWKTSISRTNLDMIELINTLPTPVMFRYLKITILNGYNSRSYQWSGFYNLRLTGVLDIIPPSIAYDDFTNNLYGYK